jgi:CubicO group peptidase (beta-lactamase class C family)
VRRISAESIGAFFRRNVAEPLGADFHIGVPQENDARTADIYSVYVGNKPALKSSADASSSVTGPYAEFARATRDPCSPQ